MTTPINTDTLISLPELMQKMNPFDTKGLHLTQGYRVFITPKNIADAIKSGEFLHRSEIEDDRENLIHRVAYLVINGNYNEDWAIVINSDFIEQGLWPICKNTDVFIGASIKREMGLEREGLVVYGLGDAQVIEQWLGQKVTMIEPEAFIHVKEPVWQHFDWNYYTQSGIQVMEPEDYLEYLGDDDNNVESRKEILNKLPANFFDVSHLENLRKVWEKFPRYASFEFLAQDSMLAYLEKYPETIFVLDNEVTQYIGEKYYHKHDILLPLQQLYREKIFKNPDACASILEHGHDGELINYFDKQQVLENEDFLARYYPCVKDDKVRFGNRLLKVKKTDNFYQAPHRKIAFFCYEYMTWSDNLNELNPFFDGWQNDKEQVIDYLEQIREKLNEKHTNKRLPVNGNGQISVNVERARQDYADIAERIFYRLSDKLSEDYEINRLFISIVPRVYEKMSEPMRRKVEFLEQYINGTKVNSLSAIPEHAIFQLKPGEALKRLVGKYPSVMTYTTTPQDWLDDMSLVVLAMREMENMKLSDSMLDAIASDEQYSMSAISAHPPVYERFSLKHRRNTKLALKYLDYCFYYDKIKNNDDWVSEKSQSLPSADHALNHVPKILWYYHDFCLKALALNDQVQHVVIKGIPEPFWSDIQFLTKLFKAINDRELKINNLKKIPMPVYGFIINQKHESSLKTFQKMLFKLKIEQAVSQYDKPDVMNDIAQERENLGRMKI